MVDSTETEEGFLHYDCKVCHEFYETSIPVKQPSNRGFYVNMIYSMMTPEWKTYSSTVSDGVTETYESIQGTDLDGEPFTYSSSGYALYKGYTYHNYSKSNGYYSMTSGVDYDYIKKVIDAVPQIYKDKVEEIGEWIIDNYFIREEVTEGYKFSVDYSKVDATYKAFRNESIESALKKTIGADLYGDIYDFIMDHYEDTLGELLDELKTRGYDIELLYNAIMSIDLQEGQVITPFNDMIADFVNVRVSTLIDGLIEKMTGSGSGSSQSSQRISLCFS